MAAKKRKTKKTTKKKVSAKTETKVDEVIAEKSEDVVKTAPEVVAEKLVDKKPVKLSREALERMAGGGATYNLTVHGMKPELKYYWSDELRLHEMELKGYTHVRRDEISGVGGGSARAGFKNISHGDGQNVVVQKRGVELYLMACPRDTYNQIQAYKQGQITEQENEIYNRSGDEFYAEEGSNNNFK